MKPGVVGVVAQELLLSSPGNEAAVLCAEEDVEAACVLLQAAGGLLDQAPGGSGVLSQVCERLEQLARAKKSGGASALPTVPVFSQPVRLAVRCVLQLHEVGWPEPLGSAPVPGSRDAGSTREQRNSQADAELSGGRAAGEPSVALAGESIGFSEAPALAPELEADAEAEAEAEAKVLAEAEDLLGTSRRVSAEAKAEAEAEAAAETASETGAVAGTEEPSGVQGPGVRGPTRRWGGRVALEPRQPPQAAGPAAAASAPARADTTGAGSGEAAEQGAGMQVASGASPAAAKPPPRAKRKPDLERTPASNAAVGSATPGGSRAGEAGVVSEPHVFAEPKARASK